MIKRILKNFSIQPYKLQIARAQGSFVFDNHQNKYLDCTSSLQSTSIGHLNERVKEALKRQVDQLTLASRALYSDKLHLATEAMCTKFGYEKCIFTNIISEAGETCIKFARRWGYEVKKVQPNMAKVLFTRDHVWGKTHAARASTNDPRVHLNIAP